MSGQRTTQSAKFDRAVQHFGELRQEVTTFLASQPYRVATKVDPESKRRIYYLASVAEIPESVPLIAGDVIQNLRSALDHLAYNLFVDGTGGSELGRHIYFPVASGVDEYNESKGRRTRGISGEALAAIDVIEPYKGGNEMVWQIGELNNIDKHRLLVTVGSSFQSLDVGARLHADMKTAFPELELPKKLDLFLKPEDNLFPLKSSDELFIDMPDAEELPDMQFRFNILLNEPGILEGAPLLESISEMIAAGKEVLRNPAWLHERTSNGK